MAQFRVSMPEIGVARRAWRAPPPRDGWLDAVEEAREFRGVSFEAHYRALAEAIELGFAILERHPERDRLLNWQDPLSSETRELMRRLSGQAR